MRSLSTLEFGYLLSLFSLFEPLVTLGLTQQVGESSRLTLLLLVTSL